MKQVYTEHEWLREIDNCTVAEAIAYLQTLPQDHKLSYSLVGDTHGCDLETHLISERPYTDEEQAALAAERKARKIANLQRSIDYYESKVAQCRPHANMAKWVDEYTQRAEQQRKKLQELTAKDT